jgi:hypothetical protein
VGVGVSTIVNLGSSSVDSTAGVGVVSTVVNRGSVTMVAVPMGSAPAPGI